MNNLEINLWKDRIQNSQKQNFVGLEYWKWKWRGVIIQGLDYKVLTSKSLKLNYNRIQLPSRWLISSLFNLGYWKPCWITSTMD